MHSVKAAPHEGNRLPAPLIMKGVIPSMNIYQPVRGVDGAPNENSFAITDNMGVEIGEGALHVHVQKKMYPDRPLQIEMTMRAHPVAQDTLFGALYARAEQIRGELDMDGRLFIRCALEDTECREYFLRMGFDDTDGDELFYVATSSPQNRRRDYYPTGTQSIETDLRTNIRREEFLSDLQSFGGEAHAPQWLQARMQEPGFVARSLYHGDELVGHILVVGNQNEAMIDMVCIEPKWRRRGAGTALAQETMDVLHSRGVPYLVARAPRRNMKAMRMLQRAGFEWARTDCFLLGRDL